MGPEQPPLIVEVFEHDGVASLSALLGEGRRSGSTAATLLPQPTEAPPETCWETDGGHLLTTSSART